MTAKYSKTQIAARLRALQEVSVELIRPQDPHQILSTIVNKAIDLLVCDAGSLYLKSDDQNLFFEVAVNRSLSVDVERTSIPLADRGLANYVFQTGECLRIKDVYRIPKKAVYAFNARIDQSTGYRTRSVIVQPLKNSKGEVVGVLQLINRKSKADFVWPSKDESQLARMPGFASEDEGLLESFAAVASASLENAKLQNDIENLFEGFVRASIQAIESRDFITRGHSDRVALLSVDLARTVSDSRDLAVREFKFSPVQISELRYAALLHDFGKIGVAESTLQKREKLSPEQKIAIRTRIEEFKSAGEIRALREILTQICQGNKVPTEWELAVMERRIREFHDSMEQHWNSILDLNQPTILNEDKSNKLSELTSLCCHGKDCEKPLLEPAEISSLSIRKGSLTEKERLEIESHVTFSYDFLKKIPWTRELSQIPEIAYAHHERLDGSGYPRKIKAEQIPIQARIMTICDIFDALVAKDRPYKRAVPIPAALDILHTEAKLGQLDSRFLKIFTDAKIYENAEFLKLYTGKVDQAA